MIEKLYITQLQKGYAAYLKGIVQGKPFEIIRLWGGKKKPETTVELHEAIRSFLQYEKKDGHFGWVIEWETWQSKKFGNQRWPSSVSILTEEDFLYLLNKKKEIAVFRQQLQELIEWNPRMADWLIARPLAVMEFRPHWKSICSVTDFLLEKDLSGFYIRNLPVPVHTKFIEKYQSIFLSLLRHLQPERFPAEAKELDTALGLRKKPNLYPIRWLDKSLAIQHTAGLDILAVPSFTLRDARWDLREIWLVENETNLYLLPPREKALAIFSKGYALHDLKKIPLFGLARLFYWGDLDEDGFIMLQHFRQYYPHLQSMLMDEKTVRFHETELEKISWRFRRQEIELQTHEAAGYRILLEKEGRIEQEKLQQDFIQSYITDMVNGSGAFPF